MAAKLSTRLPVIPAKAGIQDLGLVPPSKHRATPACWIPAFAGMTGALCGESDHSLCDFPLMTHDTPRNHGLDTLRALAITLVFMYHYMVFVSRAPTFGWASEVGWVGVDLFFVLSGYLIGNQLFAGVVRGEQLSLTSFYARRALRTWPAFWLVLAAYFVWPGALGGRTPPPLWSFLSFTQNFGLQPGTAFSHAWSLCIEEQFYLVLPLALLAALRWGSNRFQAWALLAALVAIGVAARTVLWLQYGREAGGQGASYHPWVYYATLCRFDEFLPGVAVALLKNFHPSTWQRAMRHGQALLVAGLAAVGLMLWGVLRFYYIDGYGYGFFMTAFGYSLVAMAFALLVMAALSPTSWLHHAKLPGAASIALWSYSIYLSHKAVAYLLQAQAIAQGWHAGVMLAAVAAASVAVGAALYYAVERPFMALRARRFPSNFKAPRFSPTATAAEPQQVA
jgi:peptidoglycan/LPS O-acetylase OafA/YrhL